MDAYIHYQDDQPEPEVRINPGNQDVPFAVVRFDGLTVTCRKPEQAERIAEAFTDAAARLAAALEPVGSAVA